MKLNGYLGIKDNNWNELGGLTIDGGQALLSYEFAENLFLSALNNNVLVDKLIDTILSHPKYKDKVFKATLKEIVEENNDV